MIDHARIASSFGQALDYDTYATAQRQVALRLAGHIAALPLPDLPLSERPRVLEVGCGTGFLGEALLPALPHGDWTMTDIAPAMLERARLRMDGWERIAYRVMDGEHPDMAGPFDLICSSLAVQWFDDLAAGLHRLAALLRPQGWLAFSTLAQGSFAQWREAHGDLPCGVPHYPSPEALEAMGFTVHMMDVPITGGAKAFLHHVRGIGARLPRAGYAPLSPGQLRVVMRRFNRNGGCASYRVALCFHRK
jgi:malonyl-CoA O-methyltransferase